MGLLLLGRNGGGRVGRRKELRRRERGGGAPGAWEGEKGVRVTWGFRVVGAERGSRRRMGYWGMISGRMQWWCFGMQC